jgi:hypothetical protein
MRDSSCVATVKVGNRNEGDLSSIDGVAIRMPASAPHRMALAIRRLDGCRPGLCGHVR